MPSSFQQLTERLNEAQKVCILTHIRPDGDAYGSMLGLGLCLKNLGKEVLLYDEDGLQPSFDFLPQSESVQQTPSIPPDCDTIISVDTSNLERLGNTFVSWQRQVDINIDHHTSNTRFAKINLVKPEHPACSSLIQQIIEKADWPLDEDIATSLFVGISTDTGSFRYHGTTAETLRMAANLVDAGADPALLARRCFQAVSFQKFEFIRRALNTIQFECHHHLAYIHIVPTIYQETGAHSHDTEGLIERLQEIKSVRIAALFETQSDDLLRVSLRSKDGIDVNHIAQQFGGGGHHLAAGIRIKGNPEENKEKVLATLRDSLKRA